MRNMWIRNKTEKNSNFNHDVFQLNSFQSEFLIISLLAFLISHNAASEPSDDLLSEELLYRLTYKHLEHCLTSGKNNNNVLKPTMIATTTSKVGSENAVRTNPKSDHFNVTRFHHIEFWCSDATHASQRFSCGLGMPLIAKSDFYTGNFVHASYLLRSGDLNFLFTASYSPSISTSLPVIPTFSHSAHRSFTASHGLAVCAIAVQVDSAFSAFSTAVSRGAKPSSPPILMSGEKTAMAEVHLFGDVVLRFVSSNDEDHDPNSFFSGFEYVDSHANVDFGVRGLDHAVGIVPEMKQVVEYVKMITGFHEFAEFTADEVATEESGMNLTILANNEENVLFTIIEPVFGTKRKSHVEGFLDHNEGPGVQHLALSTDDIFATLREMTKRTRVGGFEFIPPPPPTYYKNLKGRVGDLLSDVQIEKCEKDGVMVDKDDEGLVLQIFSKPVGDRPTIFIEIIQRKCMLRDEDGKIYQKGGCGGFGKGNVVALYKSIEEYEKMASTIV